MFNRIIVSATVGMLGVFVSQWASASEDISLESRIELCVESRADSDDGTDDVDAEIAFCERAALRDAYYWASEDVRNAPEWCDVTWVEQDVTLGWRAVCALVSETGGAL